MELISCKMLYPASHAVYRGVLPLWRVPCIRGVQLASYVNLDAGESHSSPEAGGNHVEHVAIRLQVQIVCSEF